MPDTDQDNAGIKLPPPFQYLGFLGAGFLADYFWPLPLLPNRVQYVAGAALIGLGLVIVLPAFAMFRRSSTAVRPDQPSSAVITGGPFRWSRNPLYLSLSLAHAGIAVAGDSIWALALLIPAMAVINWIVIPREEAYLERRFGEEYLQYKSKVRRWL